MKKILILFIILISGYTYSQDLTGYWSWESDDGSNAFDLELFIENGELKGRHCSFFYDGLKIDCIDDSSPCSVILTQASTGIYEGTIQSGFSLSSGRIQISYDSNSAKMFFKVLQAPDGEYYFPKECFLTRN